MPDHPPIVIDTREQRPLVFPAGVETVRAALPAGDYSLQGMETIVAIERKSLGDLIGSLSGERERFWRELEKLAWYRAAAVLVEDDLCNVLAHQYRSQMHPAAVLGSCQAIWWDFAIPVIWAGERGHAAEWALSFLRLAHKRVYSKEKS